VIEANRSSWQDARRVSFEASGAGAVESVALGDASGRRLAREVVALCDLPHYVSSAMDGWAVCGDAPWRVVDSVRLAPGECRAIVTGAVLPDGARAVLRSEHAAVAARVESDGESRWVTTSAAARTDEPRDGEHVRSAGTEAQSGEVLIAAGTVLNLAYVALAASAGHDGLAVSVRPRVRLVLTGDEVVQQGIPAAGQVRDSFGPMLPSLLAGLGGVVTDSIHLGDSLDAMVRALSSDPEDQELVITTGSTGSSSADHLRRALSELGATVLIDGIRMRPGGPTVLARLTDGRFVLGLPGNPLAAIVALLTIGDPLLAGMTGAPMPSPSRVTVGVSIESRPATSLLIPYRLVDGLASPTARTGSAMMRGLAESVGVLVCPPDGIAAGADADAFPLPWSTPTR
jgi:molybdopterin molybdotransferase